ncbi:MAG TPA: DUF4333 domain-containing protein [Actinomycetota bacterium]
MRTRTLLAGLLLLLVVLAAPACTRQLDTAGLEQQIADLLEQRGGPSVNEIDCPDDVTVEAGSQFECTASGDQATWTIEVTQTDDEGHVDMRIVDAQEA